MDSREHMNRTIEYVTGAVWGAFEFEVVCPECDGKAIERDYERVDGGAVNSYVRVCCGECGYLKDTGTDEDDDPETLAQQDEAVDEIMVMDYMGRALDAMGFEPGNIPSVLECMLAAHEYRARQVLLSNTNGYYERTVQVGCYMLAGYASADEGRDETTRPTLSPEFAQDFELGQRFWRGE